MNELIDTWTGKTWRKQPNGKWVPDGDDVELHIAAREIGVRFRVPGEADKPNRSNDYDEYRVKRTVIAKRFVEGMEDGFVSRYYNDEDVHEDGSISTSGLFGEHEIRVPYVLNGERKEMSHGFGRDYLVMEDDGTKRLVLDTEFEATYEKI